MRFFRGIVDAATLAHRLTAANSAAASAASAVASAQTSEQLKSCAPAYAKAADRFESFESAVVDYSGRQRRSRDETEADLFRKLDALKVSVAKQRSEIESDPELEPGRRRQLAAAISAQAADVERMDRDFRADSGDAALPSRMDRANILSAQAAKLSFRSSSALCLGELDAAEAFGRRSGELGKQAFDLAAAFPEPHPIILPMAAVAMQSGAIAERLAAQRAAADGSLDEASADALHSKALALARDAERALRLLGAPEASTSATFVCGHSECAQILFLAGLEERASHWVEQCSARDGARAAEEFGTSGPGLFLVPGFSEFAARFLPLAKPAASKP